MVEDIINKLEDILKALGGLKAVVDAARALWDAAERVSSTSLQSYPAIVCAL